MYWDPFQAAQPVRRRRSRPRPALLGLRQYQEPVFWSPLGMLVLHWSRQIGKSHVLAAWAARRLLTNPGRLVTVLSNSKSNGAEFIRKCAEICALLRVACRQVDLSPDQKIENMRMEIRITDSRRIGRIIFVRALLRIASMRLPQQLDLLHAFENRAIRIPCEMPLRDSLRKPGRVTTAGGVRIAATRDGAGHADEFWSLALLVRALKSRASAFAYDPAEYSPGGKHARFERKLIALC